MDMLLPGARYGECGISGLVLLEIASNDDESRRKEQEKQDRKVKLQWVYSMLSLNADRALPLLLRFLDEAVGPMDTTCPRPTFDGLSFGGTLDMSVDLRPLLWRWGDGKWGSWESKDEKIVVVLRLLRALQLMRPGKAGQAEFRRTVEKIALRLYDQHLPCKGPVGWIRTEKAHSKRHGGSIPGYMPECPNELAILIALRIAEGW